MTNPKEEVFEEWKLNLPYEMQKDEEWARRIWNEARAPLESEFTGLYETTSIKVSFLTAENVRLLDLCAAQTREIGRLEEAIENAALIIENAELGQTCWESDEDVMTLNGMPVGGTIRCDSKEVPRWWPDVRKTLAVYIRQTKEKPYDSRTRKETPIHAS